MGKGAGKGMGKGPIGQPVISQAEMFAADTPEFKKLEKTVDVLIDSSVAECGISGDPGDFNATQNAPTEEPEEELQRVHYDIAGYGNPEDEEKEYPPGPQDQEDLGEIPEESIGENLEWILKEKGEYHTFFKRMMDEEGISSIGQMSHDQKGVFFSKVSAKWKKEKGKNVAESFYNLK